MAGSASEVMFFFAVKCRKCYAITEMLPDSEELQVTTSEFNPKDPMGKIRAMRTQTARRAGMTTAQRLDAKITALSAQVRALETAAAPALAP